MLGGAVEHGLAFLAHAFRPDEVVADRDASVVTQQHETHPPYPQALGRATAITRVSSELALGRTARVVRTKINVPSADLHPALGEQLREPQLGERRSMASTAAAGG